MPALAMGLFESTNMPLRGTGGPKERELAGDPKDRTRKRPASPQSPDGSGGPEIGWGFVAEDADEAYFMRRVVFSVMVAVVACTGVWILVTAVAESTAPGPVLVAPARSPGARTLYTVVLRQVERNQQAAMRQLVSAPGMQALAQESEFQFMPLSDGSIALCVGKAERPDHPGLLDLRERFRKFATGQGSRPFASATIKEYTE